MGFNSTVRDDEFLFSDAVSPVYIGRKMTTRGGAIEELIKGAKKS